MTEHPSEEVFGGRTVMFPLWGLLRRAFPERTIFIRLAALTFLVVLFYSFDWIHLRKWVTLCTAALLRAVGTPATAVQYNREFSVILESRHFSITAECTYVDLFLLLAPLVWRARLPFTTNAIRVGLTALSVFGVNLARLVLALSLADAGAPWVVAHTLPDITLYYPAVAVFALLALRCDQKLPAL